MSMNDHTSTNPTKLTKPTKPTKPTTYTKNAAHTLLASITLITLTVIHAVPSTALAQDPPNPFDAYQADRDARPEPQPTPTPRDAETCPEPAPCPAVTPAPPSYSMRLKQGDWTAGGMITWQYAQSAQAQLDDSTSRDSTLFARVSPSLGYVIMDHVELALSAGSLWYNARRQQGGDATSQSWWLELSGRYHLPLGDNLSLMGSLGLGGFLGSSELELQARRPDGTLRTINETTDTRGATLTLGAHIGYRVWRRLQLQLGLLGTGLLGSERVESADERLRTTSFHMGLGLGVHTVF